MRAAVVVALAAVACGAVACGSPRPRPVDAPTPAGWRLVFASTFDHLDTTVWSLSTHTFGGNAARFAPRNAAIRHGHLVLTLRPERLGDEAYTGAELQARSTLGPFHYGRYEVRMRAARGSAVISSFFGFEFPPWQEIDIEFLGRRTNAVQANVYNSANETAVELPPFPILHTLPFDASAGFHTYAYEWDPTEIRWYADTILVARTTDPSQVPTHVIRPMLNLWLSTTESWAGPIDPGALPAHAEYAWVRVYRR